MEQTRHLEDPVRALDLEGAAVATWKLLSESAADHVAQTLSKQDGLRVVMISMKGGAVIPGHRAAAAISVQVLRGRIHFRVGAKPQLLVQGALLAVAGGLEHDLLALEDSDVLLTLGGRPSLPG